MSDEQNMDDLFNRGVDADKVKQTEQSLLLPNGTYTTIPPCTVTGRHFEATADKPARTVFRVFGKFTNKFPVKDNLGNQFGPGEKDGGLGFGFSPDEVKVEKDDGTVEVDRMTKNYVMLHRAYTNAFGKGPDLISDIKSYLETYPVDLRVIQLGVGENATGEPGNMVVAISAVKG